MEMAVSLLRWLARRDRCVIAGNGWQTSGYGNLVEVGIEVELESLVLRVMCSHDDIYVERIAGNKGRFFALCGEIQGLRLTGRVRG